MEEIDVLIVEDHPTLRVQLVDALTRRGWIVRGAEDGREAMQVMESFQPKVLVTDIFMPDIEGLELIRMSRSLLPDLKIIAMSGGGMGDGDFLPGALGFGADATLRKPFKNSEMADLIAETLAA